MSWPLLVTPSKEFWKFCLGFSTLVPPPKTTKPVTTMNNKMMSLTAEIRFISLIDHRVEIKHMIARNVNAPIARPLFSHSLAW
jgi:hypothetical protein